MSTTRAQDGAPLLPRRTFWKGSILLIAGVLSALGFAPLDWWPLTLAGAAVLIAHTATARTLREAFVWGWLFGLGQGLLGLNWVATAFEYQASMPTWLGAFAVLFLSGYLACYPAIVCALAWRADCRCAVGFILILASLWMLGEWLRATLFSGFGWNPLGIIWLSVPFIARSATWIGSYGLSGLAVLVAGALWLMGRRQWCAATAILLFPAGLGIGSTIADRFAAFGNGSGAAVRIVQPNIAQSNEFTVAAARIHERLYVRLSGHPTATPRLLFWPEAAIRRYPERRPKMRAAFARRLGPKDLLIFGGVSPSRGPGSVGQTFRNSVFALDSTGRLLWRYDKAHLVPFGEYLPLRSVLSRIGLSRLVPGNATFRGGPGPQSFELPGFGWVGVQICYEITFSGDVVDPARRPAFLFNPSNDAWFGAWGPPQHLAQARLRALEEGLPVIRATPNGISAVIDAAGGLVATMPRAQAGVLDAVMPRARRPTLFSRLGVWASAVLGVCLGAIGIYLSRRKGSKRLE